MNVMTRTLLGTAIATALASAWANPTGPVTVNGSSLISTPSLNVMQIVNTPGTIINWQGFSIGLGETTRFVQLNAASAVLNRVIGANPSGILGRLDSNGRVFLINPNGIVFGAGAVADVAGMIASTRDISDANFLAGNYLFNGPGNGAITVQAGAQILTSTYGPGGQVWLFGKGVTQEAGSTITAPQGQVVLAAGSTLQVGTSNLGNMTFSVTTGSADSVQSFGTIAADRGAVGLFADFVTHQGSIDAGNGGTVAMNATRELRIQGASTINAPNGAITLRGGSLLEVENDSIVNADGANGRISFESNNLLVYPGGNTHAAGGQVTFNQYQPSDYSAGAWQVVGTHPFGLYTNFSFVFRRSDGNYVLRYLVGPNNATDDREVYDIVLDRSGQVLSGPVLFAAFIETVTGNAFAVMGQGVPPLFYQNALSGIGNGGAQSVVGRPMLPISGAGTVTAFYSFLEFRSTSGTLVATAVPPANFQFNSAVPLPDGTVMAIELNSNTGDAGQLRARNAVGAATGFTTPWTNPPNGNFPQPFVGFPRPDGGFTLAGGGLYPTTTISIQNWSKIVAPYTATNSLTADAGVAATFATSPGFPPGTSPASPAPPAPPPTVFGSGSGASFAGVSGCNASVCSPEVRLALAVISAEQQAALLARGGVGADRIVEDYARNAVETLQAGQAARSDPGAAALENSIVIRDYGALTDFAADMADRLQKMSSVEIRQNFAELKKQMESHLARERLLQQLDVNRADRDSMTFANAIDNMSEDEQIVFFTAWSRMQRRGDL